MEDVLEDVEETVEESLEKYDDIETDYLLENDMVNVSIRGEVDRPDILETTTNILDTLGFDGDYDVRVDENPEEDMYKISISESYE